jgi:hypothetical protein
VTVEDNLGEEYSQVDDQLRDMGFGVDCERVCEIGEY